MTNDQKPPENPSDTLGVITAQLAELSERLVGGPRPDDPQAAARYDRSLYWLISHLSEGVHVLNNFMQVLIGRIEIVGKDLNRNEGTNQAILRATEELTVISRNLVITAQNIEKEVVVAVPEKPLYMRELHKIDTNATEIMLCLATGCEAAVFFAGSDTLLRSASFDAINGISNKPVLWGFCCAALFVATTGAFFSRRRGMRMIAAFLNTLYFSITGGAILLLSPGAMGWIFHIIAGGFAFWVLARSPSRAT